MTTFFTADRHIGHANIIKYCDRPFTSVEEMNEAIIENHNKVVKPGDVVYDLGDFCFNLSPKEIALIFGRMNGKIHLILGNHDSRENFLEVNKTLCKEKLILHHRILELGGKAWHPYMPTLCHYPMLSWNGSFHGAFQLHGHTHGTVPFDSTCRRLDVGVDVHSFTPIPWEEVVSKLSVIPSPKDLKEIATMKAKNGSII